MDILDDMGVSKLSVNYYFLSELAGYFINHKYLMILN